MPTPYRDSSDRLLTDYPRPSVAVDTAVLTVTPEAELGVLLVRSEAGGWRLPGTFLHPGERLVDAVIRALDVKAGVRGLAPRQLHVFDEPDRDDRGWVLSVAHLDVVPFDSLAQDPDRATIVPTAALEAWLPAPLPYGHAQIIAAAVAELRAEYAERPDPGGLLPEPFTLSSLRRLHEAVAGRRLLPDSFRRLMQPQLAPTDDVSEGSVGKPARLFRREPAA